MRKIAIVPAASPSSARSRTPKATHVAYLPGARISAIRGVFEDDRLRQEFLAMLPATRNAGGI